MRTGWGYACVLGVLGAFASVVGATGCKSAPACPTSLRVDPARALADHEARRQTWRSLSAEARVTQWGKGGRIRGTVLMFLEQPNRVRFDVMTAVGPAAVLTSDGTRFQLSDLREGTYLEGETCPANIARLLGISIAPEEVLLFLTGDTFVLEGAAKSMQCRAGQYVVTLTGADGNLQEIAYSIPEEDFEKPAEEQRLMLRRSTQFGPEGNKLWEATYDDYIDVDGQARKRYCFTGAAQAVPYQVIPAPGRI